MINHQAAQDNLIELADKVRDYEPGAAFRLRLLADAVNGANRDAWVAGDIYKMIDPEGIVEQFKSQQKRERVVDVLETLRNTLVLAPIIVTWLGISQATDKYDTLLQQLLKTHPDQVSQPFLYLWQEGFGGLLLGVFKLSNIALFDAALLFIILILTFATFAASQSAGNRVEQEAQQLRSDIMHALTGAALVILGKPGTPVTAEGQLDAIARQYDAMTRHTSASFDSTMRKILEQFNTTNQQVLDKFDHTTREMARQFGTMAKQSLDNITAVATKLEQQAQTGNEYIAKLSSFVAGMDTLSREMQGAASLIQQANTNLTSSITTLIAPAKEIVEQQKQLVTSAKDSAALLQGTAKTLSELGNEQKNGSTKLQESLDALEVAVGKMTQLTSTMGGYAAHQQTFLEQIGKERDAQRDLAIQMSDATVQLKEALASLNDGSKSMRSIAHDFKDIADMQRESDNSSIVQTYSNAAYIIERSGHTLSASAIQIFEASQKLADIADDLKTNLAGSTK